MRHLATYLLLVAGGNSNPTAGDVTNALSQVGIEVDQDRLNQLISELDGKDIEDIMEEGKKLLVKMGGGGAAPAAAPAGSAPAAAAPAPEAKPKVEEVCLYFKLFFFSMCDIFYPGVIGRCPRGWNGYVWRGWQ